MGISLTAFRDEGYTCLCLAKKFLTGTGPRLTETG